MKTPLLQTARSMAFATLLAACGSASAFYNPHVGTWVNRDPLEERGGTAIRAFAMNDPIRRVDSLGLAPCCKCGPDITAPLTKTLELLAGTFNSLSPDLQAKACTQIIGATAQKEEDNALDFASIIEAFKKRVRNSWDIVDLYDYSKTAHGCEHCRSTVEFNGKCYLAGQVNYAMWGKMFSLCDKAMKNKSFSEDAALGIVELWKESEYSRNPKDSDVIQAKGFTSVGFTGIGSPEGSIATCPLSGKKSKAFSFWWYWEPIKPRSSWQPKDASPLYKE